MRRLLVTVAVLIAVVASCEPALAGTWTEPDVTGLSGSLRKGEGAWLELPWTVIWQLGPIVPGAPLDPRAVERLANGNTLVTSRDSRGVYEVSPAGGVVWSYTTADDSLLTPFHATRLANGNTLIVDRWQETVIEVDPSGSVVWRYGVPDDPNAQAEDDAELPDPGELIRFSVSRPFSEKSLRFSAAIASLTANTLRTTLISIYRSVSIMGYSRGLGQLEGSNN